MNVERFCDLPAALAGINPAKLGSSRPGSFASFICSLHNALALVFSQSRQEGDEPASNRSSQVQVRFVEHLGQGSPIVDALNSNTIHGGVGREERRKAIESFTHDKNVLVMIANDAAGEGVNLQRAHLMVNYDLPWIQTGSNSASAVFIASAKRRSATYGIWLPQIRAKATRPVDQT